MHHAKVFGRREPRKEPQAWPSVTAPAPASPPPAVVDQELLAWKRANPFRFPWRPFSLMAGLCFGAASFVLPDQVNQAVQWPLYILSAAAFYAGLRKRGR